MTLLRNGGRASEHAGRDSSYSAFHECAITAIPPVITTRVHVMQVSVERFIDPRYSRPRYRLRHTERQLHLADGYTCGSYKLKRDAQVQADSINYGPYAAQAMHDSRYSFTVDRDFHGHPWRVAVRFLGERIGAAPSSAQAYQAAGEHLADIRLVAQDNPNRRTAARVFLTVEAGA